jgi:transcriptional regulator
MPELFDDYGPEARFSLEITTTPSSINGRPAVFRQFFRTRRRKSAQKFLLFSKRNDGILPVGNLKVPLPMKEKPDVLQGTLALMVLKTLDTLGPQHGYGIARRIEQISGDLLAVNQGTLYPLLLKLEHEGSIASQWGASDNNRRARFYRITAAGRKQLRTETSEWEQTATIIARFFKVKAEDLS